MDFIEKTRTLFFEPTAFFRKAKNEKKYMPILIYFLVYYLILQALNLLHKLKYSEGIFGNTGQISAAFYSITIIFALIFIVAIAFAAPFIGAGITHLGILVFGGRGKFFDTFKASTYAAVISSVYGAVLLGIGYFNPFDLSKPVFGDFLNIYTVLGIAIGIISIIHLFYAECTGLSQYHKISKIRSLMAVLFIPLILIAVVALIVVFVAMLAFR